MRGPSANANTPAECADKAGNDLGQCLKEHGGASGNGMSGTTNNMGRSRMKNDKSTEGGSGSANGMGSSAGMSDTGSNRMNATGSGTGK